MMNDSLKTAFDLLDLLEYSLRSGDGTKDREFPVGGIREVIGQIREIVGQNCASQAQAQNASTNGIATKNSIGLGDVAVGIEDRLHSENVSPNKSNNLELNRMDYSDPQSVALERMSYMNIPKVRTVPPDARGKIRELVGIDADEVS